MEQLLQLDRLHAHQRGAPVDQTLVGHIDRDAHRGLGGALAGAGLQHEQAAALDRELHVLHVGEMLLQALRGLEQLAEDLRKAFFERGMDAPCAPPR